MSKIKKIIPLTKRTIIAWGRLLKGYFKGGLRPYYIESLLGCSGMVYDVNFLNHSSYGTKNRGKTIAIVKLDSKWIPTAGFFALLLKTLCGLYYADAIGLPPVVWDWDGCTYKEKEQINGSDIVFEYYFKPTSNISQVEAINSYSVVSINEWNMDIPFFEHNSEWFDMNQDFIDAMGKVYRKYVVLNPSIQEQFNSQISTLLGEGKVLGVHFRGSDYKLNANGHPMSLEVPDYFEYIDEAIKEYGFDKVFIATDDKKALEMFKARYKNIVFYQDVERTDGDVSVAFLESGRKNHHYLLGYEVLRDAYTLAACDGFIGGQSQVCVNVRINRSSMNKEFDYFKIIKKGINRNAFDWQEYFYENITSK